MRHSSQNVRGQVRNLHPRQNQKTRIVCDTANVSPPRFRTPTDVAVAAAEMAWRRTPRQTRDRPNADRFRAPAAEDKQAPGERVRVEFLSAELHQRVDAFSTIDS